MSKLLEDILELTDASRNGKLVFFVGAGVSTLSEYPRWNDLIDKYYCELYGKAKEEKYSADDYIRIPQIFHDVKGSNLYDQILKDTFSVERTTNPIHDKILAMNPAHIITTNYDNLIEKACWKRGKYFSVISSEEDVAQASSPKYVLKVHGDFSKGYKGNHIVLKESDYINFEQSRPLISNLMKTIMATHTIVFIGYGLGDYNINLLLNWVKTLQKESYKKPLFIRTDPSPIENNIAIYYENKGLRIMDAATIVKTDELDYLERYNAIMDLLIESRDNNLLLTESDVTNYLYDKLQPLFKLSAVRKSDLNHTFNKDYSFSIDGSVIPCQNPKTDYMKTFFEAIGNKKNKFSEETQLKFNEILSFFEKNGITHHFSDRESKIAIKPFNIKNPVYHWDTKKIEEFIHFKINDDLEDNYKKAFFLASIGQWEESYDLYSKLLLQSIEESNWWIHYLSQLNRFWIYQSIVQRNKQLLGMHGFLVNGRRVRVFSENFIKRIEREMKNFDISEVFKSMPYEFQKKYKTLEFLSTNEFLYKDIVKLFDLTRKIRSAISSGSYSFGLTSEIETQLRLNDNLRFIYENYLWIYSFVEFKNYIRDSLIIQFEKNAFEYNRPKDDLGLMSSFGSHPFYLDYFDFLNMAKTFELKDVKHVEKICKLETVEIHDCELIEDYLLRLADEIVKLMLKEHIPKLYYDWLIPEAKTAFYLAKYVKVSDKSLLKILNMLLFHFPERDFDIGQRYRWIERITLANGLPEEGFALIEDFLLTQTEKYKTNNYSEDSSNGFTSKNFVKLMLYFNDSYFSERLSNYAMLISNEMKKQMNFMFSLYPILNKVAKSHIMQLKQVETMNDFMTAVEVGAINNITEYQELILDYLDNQKSIDSDQTVIFPPNHYIIRLGIWYFLGEITSVEMKKYTGMEAEYDFLVDPENFNYDMFVPSWLLTYSNQLLEKISANIYMRENITEILSEFIVSTNDKRYVEIFLKHFTPLKKS